MNLVRSIFLAALLLNTAILTPANASDWPKKYRLLQAPASYRENTPLPLIAQNGILHVRLWMGAGLGNRLKKLASYIRYYHPQHLNIYWQNKDYVTASFFDLFNLDAPFTVTEYNQWKMIEQFSYPEPLYPYINDFSLFAAAEEFPDNQHRFIDHAYNEIPANIKSAYRNIFKMITPSEKVQKRIDEVKLDEHTVAVQVRNNLDWERVFHRNEPEEVFFEIMDKFPADTTFYLSAMSKEAAAPFYARYGSRIRELPDKDYNSMIDAAADMFILGRTKEAVYSLGSSFSEVGWWLGGAKAKVHLAGSSDHWHTPLQPDFKVIQQLPK